MDHDTLNRIEEKRIVLEENVAKLRKALRHWQTLELDYEGLKDEFQGLSEHTTTKEQYQEAARVFGPENVDDKELHDLIEPNGKLKLPSQVIDALTRRIEYVRRNIETLRRQLGDIEKERNAVLLAQNSDDVQTGGEGDQQQAEITEQLDEDGNILSSHVQRADDTAAKVLEVVDRGLKPSSTQPYIATDDASAITNTAKSSVEITGTTTNNISNSTNQGSEVSVVSELDGDSDDGSSISETSVERTPFDTVANSVLQPTNPEDNADEARLRQEMLQYGLPEVGNIVAELEMDGGNDLDDFDNDFSELEDEYDDSDEEESEDEYGRSKRPAMSAKYRHKMEVLQKQFGMQLENVGPSPNLPADVKEGIDRPSAAEAARKAAIARHEALQSATDVKKDSDANLLRKKPKKKVAFAPTLDIAEETSVNTPTARSRIVNNDIEERTVTDTQVPETPKPARVSKFKAARVVQPQTPMLPPPMDFEQPKQDAREGPAGKTIAERLVERAGSKNLSDASAPDGDDFDEELQKRQLALEHHHLRNKYIHENGGYVQGGELENWGEEYATPTVEDEETGQPRKISRFKAARMRG